MKGLTYYEVREFDNMTMADQSSKLAAGILSKVSGETAWNPEFPLALLRSRQALSGLGQLRACENITRLVMMVWFGLLGLMLMFSIPAQAAVIKANPDRNPVQMNETFNLVFSSEERVDDDPDFSPLNEDFEIISQNQGSQVSIVNGKMSNKQEWTLTLSPKRTGTLQIPSIAFGSDRSQAININVSANSDASPSSSASNAPDDEGIKLEVEAVPKKPYVQAQVIYTVRVLFRVNVVGADLSELAVQDALIETLGDSNYNTTRNGLTYRVLERKIAIFPQKSGLLRIDPLHLTAQVEVGSRSFFSRSTRAIQVKSDSIDLEVRPIPASFTGKHWLPAADLKLEQSWSQNPPQVKAGEPLTRTLTVSALGVTKGLLPELGTEIRLDPSIKQYPDQPVLNEEKSTTLGISSSRQEKSALIPGKPGKFTMPAVEIPWWNIKTDRMEIAKIPEVTLVVEASGEALNQASPNNPISRESTESSPDKANGSAAQANLSKPIWFWLALAFGFGWFFTGLGWWWTSRKTKAAPSSESSPKTEPSTDIAIARKSLRSACTHNDPAAARTALLQWAKAYWPEQKPATLAEIASLGGGQLAVEIGHINRVLYSHAGETWEGNALWVAVQTLQEGKLKKNKESLDLEPMYR